MASLLGLAALLASPGLAAGGGGFTVGGRPVAPGETNFAGARHASPGYRIPVQINHDTRPGGVLELTLVDDVFRALLGQHRREPYLPAPSLPVVVIADAKMRRFLEGPRRLLFGKLEAEIKGQHAVYLSPTAIFIADAALSDGDTLRAALQFGLSYLFNAEFYRAVVGLDHAIPRPAD